MDKIELLAGMSLNPEQRRRWAELTKEKKDEKANNDIGNDPHNPDLVGRTRGDDHV